MISLVEHNSFGDSRGRGKQNSSFSEAVLLLAVDMSIPLWNSKTDETLPVLGPHNTVTVGKEELCSSAEESSD